MEDDNDSQDSHEDKALKRRIKTIYNIGSKNVQFDYGDKRRRSNSKDSKEDFKSENFSDSQNEKPQKPIDGKCPNCKITLDLQSDKIVTKPAEKVLIDKFEAMMLGRQSTVFGKVMKGLKNRVNT